jgi:hypothetical protein
MTNGTNPEFYFPPEALNSQAADNQFFMQEALSNYGGSANFEADPLATKHLPKVFVEDANGMPVESNFAPAQNEREFTAVNFENLKIDPVFRKDITPATALRAAQLIARDIEALLIFMALMKYEADQLAKISDQGTILTLQDHLGTELDGVEQRTSKRLRGLGVGQDTESAISDLLNTFKTEMTNGGDNQNQAI